MSGVCHVWGFVMDNLAFDNTLVHLEPQVNRRTLKYIHSSGRLSLSLSLPPSPCLVSSRRNMCYGSCVIVSYYLFLSECHFFVTIHKRNLHYIPYHYHHQFNILNRCIYKRKAIGKKTLYNWSPILVIPVPCVQYTFKGVGGIVYWRVILTFFLPLECPDVTPNQMLLFNSIYCFFLKTLNDLLSQPRSINEMLLNWKS